MIVHVLHKNQKRPLFVLDCSCMASIVKSNKDCHLHLEDGGGRIKVFNRCFTWCNGIRFSDKNFVFQPKCERVTVICHWTDDPPRDIDKVMYFFKE